MKPTARQLAYLRQLAQRTGETFTYPHTADQASNEINRLEGRPSSTASQRRRDQRSVQRDLASRPDDSTRVREHELDGYGATATWNRDDFGPADEAKAYDAPAGRRVELGRYEISSGERILEGQRIDGVVRITDRRASGDGRRYLVDRGLTSKAELDALIADYLTVSTRRDCPAIEVDLDASAVTLPTDPEPANA